MTPTTARYLELLAGSDDERCRLVEDLRSSASILDGSHWKVPPHILEQVALTLAARLRVVAAQLCDHARLHALGDGPSTICRYCERVFPPDPSPEAQS